MVRAGGRTCENAGQHKVETSVRKTTRTFLLRILVDLFTRLSRQATSSFSFNDCRSEPENLTKLISPPRVKGGAGKLGRGIREDLP